jgi:hypothetical protein
MAKSKPKYTVIKDTREQDGWFFSPYDRCTGMEVATMKTGDYTIKGYEDLVCIERKGSVTEIATNLGKKKKAFQAEMERMKDFDFRFILLEFSASDVLDYPLSLLSEQEKLLYDYYCIKDIRSFFQLYEDIYGKPAESFNLPKFKRFDVVEQTKITGRYLMKSLMEISIKCDVHIVFCDSKNNAFLICNSIFKRLSDLFDTYDKESGKANIF